MVHKYVISVDSNNCTGLGDSAEKMFAFIKKTSYNNTVKYQKRKDPVFLCVTMIIYRIFNLFKNNGFYICFDNHVHWFGKISIRKTLYRILFLPFSGSITYSSL